jgi:hypothetical protein
MFSSHLQNQATDKMQVMCKSAGWPAGTQQCAHQGSAATCIKFSSQDAAIISFVDECWLRMRSYHWPAHTGDSSAPDVPHFVQLRTV